MDTISLPRISARHALFVGACVVSIALFWSALGPLLKLSLNDSRYSHIALIPVISAGLAFLDRGRIFRHAHYSLWVGLAGALVGITGYFAARYWLPSSLTVSIAAVVTVWISAFVLCYGTRALKAAEFAALFLLLTIPVPAGAVERVSAALQAGSAELSHGLFKLLGIPVFRQGFTFSLPGVNIEVAEECSGIRSTTALVISGILAGHVFLRSGLRKALLVAFVAFVAVFKNAVRIVFLSSMAAYVNADFLHGRLHHEYGGMVFSLLALAMILPMLFMLRRSEGRT